ncbi:leucyl aminopeptidase [Corynebacterium sp. 153RC1]|uniref:leucyl aminopeptidase n=1 Tax=unclassified Corynebacterium TaxID=2624378 RepID=UPI00211C287D|nr:MULTISPECIES: leucyl aminopeptidase [unclassified Corynebacterium]MCQ9369841.1 leucyl aminopeptidase [Corynebacterium sp. 35RC1]MCQ9352286.1 leucyl aminopeptidase [Corynebacterium sp. 209RC1]MCQ9354324.1 leucyl aminopeptidase [Corynebacterium sp. 1222RC1]MCQ9356606.1 leucyl aminopeptidase [Corynebacterium sp. 122RC1]MCQ9359616.1 leucyl aminopeptidase [Corynebacterium sp. 142RC1]
MGVLPATGVATELALVTSTKKLPQDLTALLIPVFKGEDGLELAAPEFFDEETAIAVWELLSAVGATGKAQEVTRIPSVEGVEADFIAAVGLGSDEELDDEALRRAAGAAARALKGTNHVLTTLGSFGLAAAVEGIGLGAYHYVGQKSAESVHDAPVEKVTFLVTGDKEKLARDKEEFSRARITVQAVATARDLVNTPSSHLYPASYAEFIQALGKEHGVDVEVLDEKALKKQGFGGILAVGTGSARKPRLVRMSYSPAKRAKKAPKVALVGKGITFDTGGISIKPAATMDHMISDMGGSAAVVATVIAAARLGLGVNVTATIPLAENMPDGEAYRPGDVITHYGGTTSEILNTDAEGRLVLADAMARASEDAPDYLVDVATLTGAQMIALGTRTTGVMGAEDFRDKIAAVGNAVGEGAWPMPIPEEIAQDMKSPVADLRNIGTSRYGGMMAAAAYLQAFVGKGIKWAHLDIAGPAFNTSSPWGYTPGRGTGVPVRTFIELLSQLAGDVENAPKK